MISMVFDIAISAGLVLSIGYIYKTNRKLANLQKSMKLMEPAIMAFVNAVDQSEQLAKDMRSSAEVLAEEIKQASVKSEPVKTDISHYSSSPRQQHNSLISQEEVETILFGKKSDGSGENASKQKAQLISNFFSNIRIPR